ncbi:MAG: hypothetical protein U1D00_02670 [Mycobacterium sp.]|nr:hypothetical protein [Mycobacterium sp.]
MTAITETSESLLRFAIRLDGAVVALLGVALVAFAGAASALTGLPTSVEYGVGALSIAYGPLAFALAARDQVRTVGLVLAVVNVLTTAGLVVLVLTGVAGLTATGNALALVVGAYTAAIGGLQYLGARRTP